MIVQQFNQRRVGIRVPSRSFAVQSLLPVVQGGREHLSFCTERRSQRRVTRCFAKACPLSPSPFLQVRPTGMGLVIAHKSSRFISEIRRAAGPKARHHISLGQRPRTRRRRASGLKARSIDGPRVPKFPGDEAGLSALLLSLGTFLGRWPRLVWSAPLALRRRTPCG